jgi:hypothetical protein
MILVLDITDTVPVEQIVNAVSTHLAPQLDLQDQVALITFAEEIAPRTQFYIDKNRLINEHMIDLPRLEGENRLYDAILQAVSEFPADSDLRKAVLVLTDSGRRNTEQTPLQTIIERANRSKIQIYPIGYYTRDKPDEGELTTLANGTGGYRWIFDQRDNTRATIEEGVSANLDGLVRALNSELTINVRASALNPDENGRVRLNIAVDTTNDATLSDQVICPVEQLQHAIAFVEDYDDIPVTGSVDIAVSVESDLSLDETSIVFRVNNEIVQNSAETTYTFVASDVYPGYYTIGAQLVDQDSEVLATTPTTIRLYAQQLLQVTVPTGITENLTGQVQFEVSATRTFSLPLPPVQFTIAPFNSPDQAANLNFSPVPFQANGRALLVVDDIQKTVNQLFPNLPEDTFLQVSAYVPGVASEDPRMAYTSNTLSVSVEPLPAPIVPVITLPRYDPRLVPLSVILFLGVLNLLLLRMVGRRRILRLIKNPDNVELSPQLMTVTVVKDGIKQAHTLTKKTIYIGRGSSNDINLGDDPGISRQHGVIMWRKRDWYYSNRKRQAVVRINGRRYRGLTFYKLRPITEIEVGRALLIFHSNAQHDVSDFVKTNL